MSRLFDKLVYALLHFKLCARWFIAQQPHYIGRFAPSPSGPLHLGSLLTAVASYLDARAHQGKWLLRIEDIDPPREQSSAAERIISSLKAHALLWDKKILWQSQQSAAYTAALQQLHQRQLLFACTCTRQLLKQHKNYPGTCRLTWASPSKKNCAWRLNTQQASIITFTDTVQGWQQFDLQQQGGDFILQRKDRLFAYHLAVSIDDHAQGITHILRGIDLLESTAQHIFLQQCLGLTIPNYSHIPVVVDHKGHKLSKQHKAPAIDDSQAEKNLRQVLHYLQQPAPPIQLTHCADILRWATQYWSLAPLKAMKQIKL